MDIIKGNCWYCCSVFCKISLLLRLTNEKKKKITVEIKYMDDR